MSVRIGIDVGGTFTDAVAVDNDTFELLGIAKTPTTHTDPNGVAAGIIKVLDMVLEANNLDPASVSFIAHGTTQATNALLEGDVEKVGIIGLGSGVEGVKVKSDTNVKDIELAPGKFLHTDPHFVNTAGDWKKEVADIIAGYKRDDIKISVVSSAYSVDDPTWENEVRDVLDDEGLLSTCTHEISKLYGLKLRTRTSVINASILPKMLQTASMTQKSVVDAHIKAPLMIMRCDGGVMSVDEVKKRPILTMLSGPAAGVAGALMYEKISEGIFLEVGGTSTDISAIHNGQVMLDYAEVGGHKTYVNSLDVRTVAIAGGSVIRASDSDIVDVGPRSAHIANLEYLVYADPAEVSDELEICRVQPTPTDACDYIAVRDKKSGKKYALTLACAANASGYVNDGEYAKGNGELAMRGFKVLADSLGMQVDVMLEKIHKKAADKNRPVVNQLIADYKLDPAQIVLVGGGGGAAAVVHYLAESMGMKHRIAKNAEVISPIGVALAMVREIVERTVVNPTNDDVVKIRREAEQEALKSGAAQGTIEVRVEVDSHKNLLRAIATGATELRMRERSVSAKSDDELKAIAAEASGAVGADEVRICARTEELSVCSAHVVKKSFFGLKKSASDPVWVINKEGVIRLQGGNGCAVETNAADCLSTLEREALDNADYFDGGERIPACHVLIGARLHDFSSVSSLDQVKSLVGIELQSVAPETRVVLVFIGPMVRPK